MMDVLREQANPVEQGELAEERVGDADAARGRNDRHELLGLAAQVGEQQASIEGTAAGPRLARRGHASRKSSLVENGAQIEQPQQASLPPVGAHPKPGTPVQARANRDVCESQVLRDLRRRPRAGASLRVPFRGIDAFRGRHEMDHRLAVSLQLRLQM